MGEIAALLIKVITRIAFVVAGIIGFIVITNMAYSLIFVTLNGNILSDLFKLVQIWMPFNLGVLLAWVISAATLYIVYRLAVAAIGFISHLTGR